MALYLLPIPHNVCYLLPQDLHAYIKHWRQDVAFCFVLCARDGISCRLGCNPPACSSHELGLQAYTSTHGCFVFIFVLNFLSWNLIFLIKATLWNVLYMFFSFKELFVFVYNLMASTLAQVHIHFRNNGPQFTILSVCTFTHKHLIQASWRPRVLGNTDEGRDMATW